MRVFLGGTTNESRWRERLINLLRVDYFDPVVDDWNAEAQRREMEERVVCDYCLYVITPKMAGVYSIAEAVEDSVKRPSTTLFCWLPTDGGEQFSRSYIHSLEAVSRLIEANGGRRFVNLAHVAEFLNLEQGERSHAAD